jgi:dipeptidyl-peptidase-4
LSRLSRSHFCIFTSVLLASSAIYSQLAAQTTKQLTIAGIFSEGNLTGKVPEGISWSPDSRYLTYLSDSGDLMEADPITSGVSVVLSHEKISSLLTSAGSEKDRDHRARYGMASYIWAPDSRHLLFDANGQLWLYDLGNGTGVQIAASGAASGDDPKFSPDGAYLSYVRDHNLQLRRLRDAGVPTTNLTNTHDGSQLNGEVDWVYEEELDVRSNYFWSPDSKLIAYLRTDENAVPEYPLVDWMPPHALVDEQRYPQPGDSNPDVRVGVVNDRGGKTNWIKIPLDPGNDYIPRFGWANRRTLWVETLSRDHKHLNIYFADTSTNTVKLALQETDDKFLDEDYDVFFTKDHFLLTSWRDGHDHIYLYSFDAADPVASGAKLDRQLTSGDYEVTKIAGIDEANSAVFYVSTEGDPREAGIWRVRWDGTHKTKISTEPGKHDPVFSPNGFSYSDLASSVSTPPSLSLCNVNATCKPYWQSKPATDYGLIPLHQLELKLADGIVLYASLVLPQSTEKATVPLIVNPYGGPHAQTVQDAWIGTAGLFDQVLAQHGFAVLHLDNRGMGSRGREFAQVAYRNLGPVQFADQQAGVDQVLERYPQLDPKRLGWWGWSWGGTFTLYAMTHSDRYIAGVSVAPVTDWRLYDSIYTERYLGTPQTSPDGYRDDSVVNFAKNLKGHLLLVHGTGDDNVHIANDVQFIQQLIDADIPYDYQVYPRKTHSIAGPEARTHLYTRILEHFETYLMNARPENATVTGTN